MPLLGRQVVRPRRGVRARVGGAGAAAAVRGGRRASAARMRLFIRKPGKPASTGAWLSETSVQGITPCDHHQQLTGTGVGQDRTGTGVIFLAADLCNACRTSA
jgi:hypothetical protein